MNLTVVTGPLRQQVVSFQASLDGPADQETCDNCTLCGAGMQLLLLSMTGKLLAGQESPELFPDEIVQGECKVEFPAHDRHPQINRLTLTRLADRTMHGLTRVPLCLGNNPQLQLLAMRNLDREHVESRADHLAKEKVKKEFPPHKT